jgi:hypothetical protein
MRQRRRTERTQERGTKRAIARRSEMTGCDDAPADAFGMLAGSVLGHDDIVAPDTDAWAVSSARRGSVSDTRR